MEHGTFSRWLAGCMCDKCYEASKTVNEMRKITPLEGGIYGKPSQPALRLEDRHVTHGTRSTYFLGCRCEPCRKRQADYQKDYYWRNLDKCRKWHREAMRRIRALQKS